MRNKFILGFAVIALILIPLGAYLAFSVPLIVTPAHPDGDVSQKIFYFHVPVAWTSLLSFLIGAIGAICFLSTRKKFYDILELSAIEVGMAYGFLVEYTGMIWDRTAWGTWWTWEPRLTTYLILMLVYAGYFVLRSSVDSESSRARYAAVYAIVASIMAPLTFFSIRLLPSVHPVVFGAGGASMEPEMLRAFAISMVGMTSFYISLLLLKIGHEEVKEELHFIKEQIGS